MRMCMEWNMDETGFREIYNQKSQMRGSGGYFDTTYEFYWLCTKVSY